MDTEVLLKMTLMEDNNLLMFNFCKNKAKYKKQTTKKLTKIPKKNQKQTNKQQQNQTNKQRKTLKNKINK